MLDDLFLLTKIREGDVKAFEELFRRYYSQLCWYAAGITGQMEVAEELVEELFYTIWKEKEQLKVIYSLKSYLYGAIRNESLKYFEHLEVRERYRKLVMSGKIEKEEPDPQKQLEYAELESLIDQTLNKLPDRRLQIFKMHRLEGKKYAEIAVSLSLSVKTIEAEMTKALRTLRTEIENYIQIT